jgi:hypothetical protein
MENGVHNYVFNWCESEMAKIWNRLLYSTTLEKELRTQRSFKKIAVMISSKASG